MRSHFLLREAGQIDHALILLLTRQRIDTETEQLRGVNRRRVSGTSGFLSQCLRGQQARCLETQPDDDQ